MAIHTDLSIHKTACDLLGVAIDATKHMSRDFKATLGGEMRKECVAITLLIMRANVAQDKTPDLTRLLERVEVFNLLMSVSHDKRLISPKIYAEAIKLTGSIGRQAGGWRKHAEKVSASSLVASSSRR